MPVVSTKPCRHGVFSYYNDDLYLGRALELYGEYSEEEVELMRRILRPGHVALDVGANIGAITVPIAKLVAPTGLVLAFEPQPENFKLLLRNIEQNKLTNINAYHWAVGDAQKEVKISLLRDVTHKNYGMVELVPEGVPVNMITIDSLNLAKVDFIKLDVEGCELEALQGAAETIKRCRPIMYIENDRDEKSAALIDYLKDELCYNLWWHLPVMYNPDNYRRNRVDVFPRRLVSKNMLAVHESVNVEIEGLDELIDSRLDAGTYARMIARYQRMLRANSDALEARTQMGYLLALLGRTEEAQAAFDENLRRDPDNKRTKYVSSILHHHAGDYRKAWPLQELRYEMPKPHLWGHRSHPVPQWDGKDTDEVVLISSEQGFGDQIMFARFWSDVLDRAPNAILEVQPQLYELFQQSGFAPLYRKGRSLPAYSKWCASPSLPFKWNLSAEQVGMDQPYLFADPALTERWKKSLPKNAHIGLCWQGSPTSERGFTRDIDIGMFKPLTDKYDHVALSNFGQFESYADTAACIAALDLVITVDTSIAHLAGAMGWPVWLLCPLDCDWRWLKGSDTSPWYPSMRVFQQTKLCDWASVLERVLIELEVEPVIVKAA